MLQRRFILFICVLSAHASPPSPPAPPLALTVAQTSSSQDENKAAELRRGAQQIFRSDAYIDLRSITSVRRATQPTVPRFVISDQGNIPGVNQSLEEPEYRVLDAENGTASDAEDEGGDDVLNAGQDKTRLKLNRSFELVLRTGHVVRFEVRDRLIMPPP